MVVGIWKGLGRNDFPVCCLLLPNESRPPGRRGLQPDGIGIPQIITAFAKSAFSEDKLVTPRWTYLNPDHGCQVKCKPAGLQGGDYVALATQAWVASSAVATGCRTACKETQRRGCRSYDKNLWFNLPQFLFLYSKLHIVTTKETVEANGQL